MKRIWMSLFAGVLLLAGSAAAQDDDTLTAMAYGTVNVRSGPGATYEIVGQLAAGDRVPVDGRDTDGDWLRVVLTFGQSGWVASFAVVVTGDIPELPVVEADDGDGESVAVRVYGTVNIRSGPGMNFPITGQLDAGDTLPVLGRSSDRNDWLYVQQDDIEGWVAYFTVTVVGDAKTLPVFTVDGSGQMIVPQNNVIRTRYNVRLRDAAAVSAGVLEVVPFNSIVTPLARTDDGEWLYVMYRNTSGWGLAGLFDISDNQLEALPVYNATVLTPTPTGGR